jgi:hypothetical protein
MASKRSPRLAGHRPFRAAARPTRGYRPALESFEPRLLLSGNTYTVNALTDTGAGSGLTGDLRYAITQAHANPGSTIDITAAGTDTLGSPLPGLSADVTITDGTPGSFVVSGGGAGSNYDALAVFIGVTATISGVDFTNFASSGNGGILSLEGTLTLDDAVLSNSSGANGGAVYVSPRATFTANRCTFHDNSAANGGGLFSFHTVNLNGCTVRHNSSQNAGGGIYDKGALDANGVLVADNSAATEGGGVYCGLNLGTSGLTLTDSTVTSNTAGSDGGGLALYFSAALTNDTIADNGSPPGPTGAGVSIGSASYSPVLRNTIVAQNLAGSSESDVDGAGSIAPSSSYNLIGDSTVSGAADGSQGNMVGTSASPIAAGLGSLADNGGLTETMAPSAGSPALGAGLVANAVDPRTSDPLPYDQRGAGFARVVNGSIDLGAFQTQAQGTSLAVSDASGVYGGTTALTARLTSGGNPVAGELVDFLVHGVDVGTAATNASGLATLKHASLGFIDVGGYPGGVTAGFAGGSGYGASDGSANLTVTPAPLVITANNRTKVYGQADPALTGTVTGVLNGDRVDAAFTTTATQSSDVRPGGYPITPAGLTGAKALDYTVARSTPGTLTVTPAPLTVTANDATRVFGQPNPGFVASYGGFVLGQDASALTGKVGFSTTATTQSQVGLYPVTPGGVSAADYAIRFVAGTLAVTPARLTVTPVDVTKAYGLGVPALAATYSGFVNGDTPASLTRPVTLTTTATAESPAGAYPITGAGAVSPDYTMAYKVGTLIVAAPTPADRAAFVTSLYENILGRAPEPSGMAYWLQTLADGVAPTTVFQVIYGSPEAVLLRAGHKAPVISQARALALALQALGRSGPGGS